MKLLVGYDGSNSAKTALDLACAHAKVFGATMEVLTTVESGSVTEVIELEYAKEDLASVEAQVKQQGISVNTHVINKGMKPGEDIVTFAAANAVDAIYIGVKRRSKVGKLLYGSNAQYVIIRAHCPVTVVK